MSKFQGVLKMFMLGVLKTISKTMLKYEKTPSHFMARVEIERQIFVFLLPFCTRKRSETYIYIHTSVDVEYINVHIKSIIIELCYALYMYIYHILIIIITINVDVVYNCEMY